MTEIKLPSDMKSLKELAQISFILENEKDQVSLIDPRTHYMVNEILKGGGIANFY